MVGLTPANGGRGAHRRAPATPRSPTPPGTSGVLLDASAQHAGRTGREVLRLSAETMGVGPRARRGDARAGRPQRQRGQAPHPQLLPRHAPAPRHRQRACSGDPSVLILDEPVNGLDPAGIHWMRGVLRQFAGNGGTVLLSSHLLHEVEMIADELIVIGRGKIVAQGTRAELLQTAGTYVKAEDPAALDRGPASAPASRPSPSGDGGFRSEVDPIEVGRAAAPAGVVLIELRPRRGRRARGDVPAAHRGRRPRRRRHRRRSQRMSTTAATAATLDISGTSAGAVQAAGRRSSCARRVDTRAGLWLLGITSFLARLTVIVLIVFLINADQAKTSSTPSANVIPQGLPAARARHPPGHLGVEPAHRHGHLHPRAAPRPRCCGPR